MPLIGIYVRSPLLLGQIDNWRRLGDHFSGEHLEWRTEDALGWATVVLAFAGGFWVLSRLGSWQERSRDQPPKRLFAELAAAHRLSYLERRLCRAVARDEGLREPAELFVRVDLAGALAARNASLAARLFDNA
ncbi:hypothetical protein [Botrimarina sp.]|uniref:hypothetical protein n=1 Tax=Botrimarina sp. TaxID=2795802 RepID=UPI0032EBB4B8